MSGLVAFAAGTAAPADRMRAAFELQESIKRRRAEIEQDEERMMQLYTELMGIDDEVFVVTNLRAVREVDVDWVRENLPAVYAQTIGVSPSACGQILSNHFTREELNNFLSGIDKDLFDEKATIKITDFDRAVGGKKESRRYQGKAYNVQMKPWGATEIVYKHPEMYAALAEGDADV